MYVERFAEMRTIVVANSKGGVGKTTISVHLAGGFATYYNQRVLLVDLDQQANSTSWFLGDIAQDTPGTYEMLTRGELNIYRGGREGAELYISPATERMRLADSELKDQPGGELALRERLEQLESDFDLVVLDCPPNLGAVTLNAICAGDALVMPVLPADLSIRGIRQFESTMALAQRRLRAKVKLLGYLLFASDKRHVISREVRELLSQDGGPVFETEIRPSINARSLSAGSKLAYDSGFDVKGKTDYTELLKETASRLERLGCGL